MKSKAQQIREMAEKIPAPSPGTIARKLGVPQNYVLRVAWPKTYRSVKAADRERERNARRAA